MSKVLTSVMIDKDLLEAAKRHPLRLKGVLDLALRTMLNVPEQPISESENEDLVATNLTIDKHLLQKATQKSKLSNTNTISLAVSQLFDKEPERRSHKKDPTVYEKKRLKCIPTTRAQVILPYGDWEIISTQREDSGFFIDTALWRYVHDN